MNILTGLQLGLSIKYKSELFILSQDQIMILTKNGWELTDLNKAQFISALLNVIIEENL